jgi:hypothetical protein
VVAFNQTHLFLTQEGVMSMANGIIRLHGRQYKTVALRVQEFREKHPIDEGWGLCTKIVHVDAETVLFRASIVDPQGREIAIGFAEEKRTNRGINSTSALENCETSALGRALAAAGYGGSEYASADELVSALNQQRQGDSGNGGGGDRRGPDRSHHPSWTRNHKPFIAALKNRDLQYEAVAGYCEKRKWGRPASWTTDERSRFLEDLDRGAFKDLYDPESAAPESHVPDEGAGEKNDLENVA